MSTGFSNNVIHPKVLFFKEKINTMIDWFTCQMTRYALGTSHDNLYLSTYFNSSRIAEWHEIRCSALQLHVFTEMKCDMIDYLAIVLLQVEKPSYVESILYICCCRYCGAISDELV